MKRLLIIGIITVSLLNLVGCGTTKQEVKEPVQEEVVEEKPFDTTGYKKADFVELNVFDEDFKKIIGDKVFAEGEVSFIDLEGRIFDKRPNLKITNKTANGYEIFIANGYELKDSKIEFKDGDRIRVYGIVDPQKIMFGPTILVEHIEKVE